MKKAWVQLTQEQNGKNIACDEFTLDYEGHIQDALTTLVSGYDHVVEQLGVYTTAVAVDEDASATNKPF